MFLRRIDWAVVGPIAIVVLLVAVLGYADWRSAENCTDHGGHEVVTGYVVTTSKNVTSVSPVYSCEGAH